MAALGADAVARQLRAPPGSARAATLARADPRHTDVVRDVLCCLAIAAVFPPLSFSDRCVLSSEPMSACSAALALGGGGTVRRIASPQDPALSSALGGSLDRLSF
jgi:hypothetical protein